MTKRDIAWAILVYLVMLEVIPDLYFWSIVLVSGWLVYRLARRYPGKASRTRRFHK